MLMININIEPKNANLSNMAVGHFLSSASIQKTASSKSIVARVNSLSTCLSIVSAKLMTQMTQSPPLCAHFS